MADLLDEMRQDLGPILATFPREKQMLLPALQHVQRQLGYLPLWAQQAVGEYLRVPESEVYGVATHFPELHLEAPGKHRVRVCTGLSCRLLGSSAILQALEGALGLTAGRASADASLSLEESHCAFICGVAPVVEVDGSAYGKLSPEQAVAVVEQAAGGANTR